MLVITKRSRCSRNARQTACSSRPNPTIIISQATLTLTNGEKPSRGRAISVSMMGLM